MKILVTAFEPFGGQTMNPAQEAVGRLPLRVEGADISRVTLPVAFGRDGEVLVQEIGRHDPDVCLCVGQAGGRAQVTPEFVGINYMLARIPDNEGARPAGIPVVEGGPAAYFTTLPVHAMVARMRERSVPASVSYSAGTFCCNEVLYTALHAAATAYPRMRAGFIHVPFAPEQVERSGGDFPSMPVDMMVEALTIAIETCVAIRQGDIVSTSSGTES